MRASQAFGSRFWFEGDIGFYSCIHHIQAPHSTLPFRLKGIHAETTHREKFFVIITPLTRAQHKARRAYDFAKFAVENPGVYWLPGVRVLDSNIVGASPEQNAQAYSFATAQDSCIFCAVSLNRKCLARRFTEDSPLLPPTPSPVSPVG